jgi:hypothetical protein
MTNHPTKDWDFDDTIEEEFQKWFNDDSWMEICGGFSFRSEWFYGDCEVGDVKTRQDLMYKWLHSAFVVGYNAGRLEGTKVGLTDNE